MQLIPAWAPNVHPMVVHFPVVLVMLAAAADVVHLVRPRTGATSRNATVLYVLGAVSALVVYFSGRSAASVVFIPGMAHGLVDNHQSWGLLTTATFAGVAALRLGAQMTQRTETRGARIVFVALGLVLAMLVQQTAERGARLVYEQGVGVIPGAVFGGGGTNLEDAGASAVFDGSGGRWIDLTYTYSEETIFWPTAEGFRLEEVAFGETELGYFYSAYNISTAEHGGTHLDAPFHFSRGGMSTEQIPLDRLIAPAVVVDVSARATPDYRIDVTDLEDWEREHGRIPDGTILLLRTGWGERWPDRLSYMGTELTGPEAVAELHFPGIHPDAARWMTEERAIAAVGIDTPSIDYGQSTGFEAHVIIYGANIPGFENVANMDQLPEEGAFVVALPMKIAGGSGGPLRIVAFVPTAGTT